MKETAAVAEVSRVMNALPGAVYAEWLDPDSLLEWMCPRPARCLSVQVDPRVGGRLHIEVEESGSTFSIDGAFTTLDAPNRLAFTWRCTTWPAASSDSLVTVTLTPYGDRQTLMTIRHTLLAAGLGEQHERGWRLIAGQLADKLPSSPMEPREPRLRQNG